MAFFSAADRVAAMAASVDQDLRVAIGRIFAEQEIYELERGLTWRLFDARFKLELADKGGQLMYKLHTTKIRLRGGVWQTDW